jgi:hypothetical protein
MARALLPRRLGLAVPWRAWGVPGAALANTFSVSLSSNLRVVSPGAIWTLLSWGC